MTALVRMAVVVVAAVGLPARLAGAQEPSGNGVFIRTADAVTELVVYAEPMQTGRLRMARGKLDQAPAIHELSSILASLPNWRPLGVFMATTALFRNDQAERRLLPTATRMRNVYATDIRVVDLERRESITALLESIDASANTPGYAFVMMGLGGVVRYYPFRLTLLEQ